MSGVQDRIVRVVESVRRNAVQRTPLAPASGHLAVMRALGAHSVLTAAGLARVTGLSAGRVRAIVAELERAGEVEGQATRSPGRPVTMVWMQAAHAADRTVAPGRQAGSRTLDALRLVGVPMTVAQLAEVRQVSAVVVARQLHRDEERGRVVRQAGQADGSTGRPAELWEAVR